MTISRIAILCFGIWPVSAACQDWTSLSPATQKGVPPFVAMDGEEENVNLSNGNVNITVPLLHLKGRAGMDLDLAYQLDNKIYSYQDAGDMWGGYAGPDIVWDDPYPPIGVGRLSIPTLRWSNTAFDGGGQEHFCQANFIFEDSAGQSVAINYGTSGAILIGQCWNYAIPQQVGYPGQGGGGYGGTAGSPNLPSADPVYLDLSNFDVEAVVHQANGNEIHFPANSNFPSKIIDKNGNIISFSTTATYQYGLQSSVTTVITDTVGRQVTINWPSSGSNSSSISYNDSNGNSQSIVFTSGEQQPPQINVGMHGCEVGDGPGNESQVTAYVGYIGGQTETVSIPTDTNPADNRVYTFSLDYVGEIASATYPSGGQTAYAYQTLSAYDGDVPCASVDVREIQQKQLSDANNNVATTTYTPAIYSEPYTTPNGAYSNYTMAVLSNSGRQDLHTFNRSYDTEVDTVDTNTGQALRTVLYNPNSYGPTTVTTKLLDVAPGSTATFSSVKTVGYVPLSQLPNGPLLVQSEQDQDYNGAVLKNIATGYQTANGFGQWPQVKSSEIVSDSHGMWKTTFGYDERGPTGSGATQHQAGHNFGNVTSATKWNGSSSYQTLVYRDDAGNVTQVTDPNGHSTYANYSDSFEPSAPSICLPPAGTGSAAAYPSVITNAKGQQTIFQFYSCSGLVKQMTDPNHQPTSMTYDALGRNLTTTYPDGGSTTNTYHDPSPSWFSTAIAMSPTETYYTKTTYDGLAREIASQIGTDSDPNETVKTTTYDSNGNTWDVITTSPAGGALYQDYYYYDVLNRPIEHDDALGQQAYTTYYANMAASADIAGNTTQRTTDALGRLTSMLEPDATTGVPSYLTSYQYDSVENLWQVDQWGGPAGSAGDRQRTFVYNGLSQLTSAYNPESGTIGYSYDPAGNLQTRTDANHTVLYCYDQLNRLLSKSTSDQTCPANAPSAHPYATMTYDSGIGSQTNVVGRLSSTTGIGTHAHTRLYSYDQVGRIKSLQDSFVGDGSSPHTTSFGYDWAGDATTVNYPSQQQITRVWNNHKQLTSITSGTTSYLSNATYDFLGGITSKAYGNGITESIAYNPMHQVDSIWVSPGAGQPPAFFRGYCYNGEDYSYACGLDIGNNGNVTQIVGGPNGTKNFTYDTLNRLTSYQVGSSPATAYSIDPWGNMSGVPTGGGQQVTFGALNRISNALCTGSNGSPYDGAGNQLCDGNPAFTGTVHEYAYNPDNQVTSVSNTSFALLAMYTLSGDGARVRKDIAADGSWKEYFIANGQVTSELSSSGIWSDYIYAGGQKMARVDSAAGSVTASRYYIADPLGTAQIEFSGAGQQIWQGDFDPWGAESDNNATTNNYKFTGKERDSESGNDYFDARYYASSIGRFMLPDPLLGSGIPSSPQTWNRYAYVLNAPLKMTDPTGMYVCGNSDNAADCDAIKNAISAARTAISNLAMTDGAAALAVAKSLANLGDFGKPNAAGNNVTIDVSDTINGKSVAGADLAVTGPTKGGKLGDMTITMSKHAVETGDMPLLVHEGVHVGQPSMPQGTASKQDWVAHELPAFIAQGAAAEGFHSEDGHFYPLYTAPGMNGNAVLWNATWDRIDIMANRYSGAYSAAQRDAEADCQLNGCSK